MSDQKTYEQERDEAAVTHTQKRHNGLDEIEVRPTGSYQGFIAGYDACKSSFEKIVAEKNAILKEYKNPISQIQSLESQLNDLATEHGLYAARMVNKVNDRDAMIEKLGISLKWAVDILEKHAYGDKEKMLDVQCARDDLNELSKWKKTK